jgi:hypothetical protein
LLLFGVLNIKFSFKEREENIVFNNCLMRHLSERRQSQEWEKRTDPLCEESAHSPAVPESASKLYKSIFDRFISRETVSTSTFNSCDFKLSDKIATFAQNEGIARKS